MMDKELTDLPFEVNANATFADPLPTCPLTLLRTWLREAIAGEVKDAHAMTLASCDHQGRISARMVLLKQLTEQGLIFFTNYHSLKGKQLQSLPQCALVFWWFALARQVRVEGCAERLPSNTVSAYFATRSRASQLGAWASSQSQEIADHTVLEQNYAARERAFADHVEIPCPPHWGGYLVRPAYVEFWLGKPHRLHQRMAYLKQKGESWRRVSLAP